MEGFACAGEVRDRAGAGEVGGYLVEEFGGEVGEGCWGRRGGGRIVGHFRLSWEVFELKKAWVRTGSFKFYRCMRGLR